MLLDTECRTVLFTVFSVVTFFLYPISNGVYKAKQTAFLLELLSFVVSLLSVQVTLTCHRAGRTSLFICQINSGLNHSAHELYCWEGRGLEESK